MNSTKIKGLVSLLVAMGTLASCGKEDPAHIKAMKGFDASISRTAYSLEFKENYKVEAFLPSGEADTDPTFKPFLRDLENVKKIKVDHATGYVEADQTIYNKEDVWTEAKHRVVAYYAEEGVKKMISSDDREVTELAEFPQGYDKLETYTAANAGSFDEASLLFKGGEKHDGQDYMVKYFTLKQPTEATPFGKVEYEVNKAGGIDATYNAAYVGYKTDQGITSAGADKGAAQAAVITVSTDAKGYVTSAKEVYTASFRLSLKEEPTTIKISGSREMKVSYDAVTPLTAETIEQIEAKGQIYITPAVGGAMSVYQYDGLFPFQPGSTTLPVENLAKLAKGTKIAVGFAPEGDLVVGEFKVNGVAQEVGAQGWMGVVGSENIKLEVKFTDPEVKETAFIYQGTLGAYNITQWNLYKDGTFDCYTDSFGAETKVCEANYVMDEVNHTVTYTITNKGYLEDANNGDVFVLSVGADYSMTGTFAGAEANLSFVGFSK